MSADTLLNDITQAQDVIDGLRRLRQHVDNQRPIVEAMHELQSYVGRMVEAWKREQHRVLDEKAVQMIHASQGKETV